MPAHDIHFQASALIHARPEIVWGILTDYHQGHPQILPPDAFSDFHVEAGGKGAGTRTAFVFRVFGSRRAIQHIVSAPIPGQRLIEAEPDGASRTIFTLTPLDDGRQTEVIIVTEQRGHSGVTGAIERLAAPLLAPTMRRIYLEELRRLDALAQRWPVAGAHPAD